MKAKGTRTQREAADAATRDAAFFRERERQRALGVEQTARLRALRLEKEARERAAAQSAADEKKTKSKTQTVKRPPASVS